MPNLDAEKVYDFYLDYDGKMYDEKSGKYIEKPINLNKCEDI